VVGRKFIREKSNKRGVKNKQFAAMDNDYPKVLATA